MNRSPRDTVRALGLLLLALCVAGCTTIYRDEAFTFREATTIDTSVLRLDGYYYKVIEDEEIASLARGTEIKGLLLWRDGTAAIGLYGSKYLRGDPGDSVYWGNLKQAQASLESNLDGFPDGHLSLMWGAFRIEGDAITMQFLSFGTFTIPFLVPFWPYYGVSFRYGTIPNDTTIHIKRVERRKLFEKDYDRPVGMQYHFKSLPPGAKPDSSNWIHDRYRTE